MALFGSFKKYPTPIVKPLWPFFIATGVVAFGISKAATASMNSEEFYNDPRHPRFIAGGKIEKSEH
ncbi:similar to Saccharomyces cerevisiae YML081C-A ATP18 Subunit of the mitochondrial F1F0 ATP synthase [Geotrichum candidum]|uniref:Similar to Saccharomyces cerevisiae YML081C-A ATP18 Subunit of the mitochondrial F1F0 ATP synthase n=1 Tax=Geotrichum candidum TaxID=1173061 RepID=A0A0J9X854_GEOCN|nr:similar to Saccharomyces cerevisiae YML081C-A ATP18 Subunit of the mitochondrial F1F0 ATP synthase [Geotrichum candidum]